MASPHGSIAPSEVRLVGGSAADRAALATILRGFGRSEISRVAISGPVTRADCEGAWFHVTVVHEKGQDQRGWWEAQVISGAFPLLRRRRVCSISLRRGPDAMEEGAGPGVSSFRYIRVPEARLTRAVRVAARSTDLQLVGMLIHRPARRPAPEIVLVARDPTDFEERIDRFQRRLFPLEQHLDGYYVAVRNPCGKTIWSSAVSNATGAGGAGADRHWICPFGDAINQRCPKRRATRSSPCP